MANGQGNGVDATRCELTPGSIDDIVSCGCCGPNTNLCDAADPTQSPTSSPEITSSGGTDNIEDTNGLARSATAVSRFSDAVAALLISFLSVVAFFV